MPKSGSRSSFKRKDTLVVYRFMYGPDMEAARPSCTSILDGPSITTDRPRTGYQALDRGAWIDHAPRLRRA